MRDSVYILKRDGYFEHADESGHSYSPFRTDDCLSEAREEERERLFTHAMDIGGDGCMDVG
jgi:hypothetical protein